MKQIIIWVSALAVALSLLAAEPLTTEELLDRAQSLSADGLCEAAIPLYRRLLDSTELPADRRAFCLLRLADCQLQQGDLQGARTSLQELQAKHAAWLAEQQIDSGDVQSITPPRPLTEIIIPELILEPGTPIKKALAVIREEARTHDPAGQDIEIVFLMKAPGDGLGLLAESGLTDDQQGGPLDGLTTPGLYLRDIPLTEVIRYLCLQAGLHYRVDGNIIRLGPVQVPLEPLETRFYPFNAAALGLATQTTGDDDDDDDDDQGFDAVSFFSKLGVAMPDGARLVVDRRTGRLIATNTPDQLATLERILAALDTTPRQIQLSVEVFDIQPPANLDVADPAVFNAESLAQLPADQRQRVSRLVTIVRAGEAQALPVKVRSEAELTISRLAYRLDQYIDLELIWQMPGPNKVPYLVDTSLTLRKDESLSMQLDRLADGRHRWLVITASVLDPEAIAP